MLITTPGDHLYEQGQTVTVVTHEVAAPLHEAIHQPEEEVHEHPEHNEAQDQYTEDDHQEDNNSTTQTTTTTGTGTKYRYDRQCPSCGNVLSTLYALKLHIAKKHPDEQVTIVTLFHGDR